MVRHEQTRRTLKTGEVAWLLSTDRKTVQQWAKAGIMRPYRTNGLGDLIFKREDVACLLAKLGA